MENAIVVADSIDSVSYTEGQIISGASAVALAESKGAIVLPYEPKLHGRGAVRGYFRRAWGQHGWPLTKNAGERVCPMVLDVVHGFPCVYWAAFVISTGPDPKAQIRLANDTSSGSAGVLSAADQPRRAFGDDLSSSREFESVEGLRGWIVGGKLRVHLAGEGYFGLSLYTVAKDVSVIWAAVTQAADVTPPVWLPL